MFNSIIYDEIIPFQQSDVLKIILIAFLVVSFSSSAVGFVKQWILLHLSIKINIPLMLGYFGHVYKLPMKFFSSRRTGDITTRFSDAFTIKEIFTNIALSIVMDISTAIISGIFLFRLNVSLFSIIMIITIVNFLLFIGFRQPYKKINEEQMHQASVLNSEIIEGLRGIETIKCNANETVELENIEREYIRALRIGYKENMLSNFQNVISGVVSTIGNLALIYVGISQVINNEITLGTYMAFTTLSGYFLSPINNLIGLQLSIQEANISMKRLSEIMDYEAEQGESGEQFESYYKSREEKEMEDTEYKKIDKISGDIVFDNVTFRYGNRKPAVSKINIRIKSGEKVAIVGTSGSGKSTIAKLLLKYYEPEEGTITLDGVDLREIDNNTLRKSISFVPQNIELFSKSIFDNIRLSKWSATLGEVVEASKTVFAHEFIKKMPLQYKTYLEEAGNGLSGGEKQRIVLARALLKNNELYVFDEGTSSLDFMTENAIFNMIFNKLNKKTMLIIAHRLSTVRNCDRIIVMDDGKIIEEGTHDELIKKGRIYHKMWTIQQGSIISHNEEREGIDICDEDVGEGIVDEVMVYT